MTTRVTSLVMAVACALTLAAEAKPPAAARTVTAVDAKIAAVALPEFERMIKESRAVDAGQLNALGDPKNFVVTLEDRGRNTVVRFTLVGHADIEGGGLQVTVDRTTLTVVESHLLK